MATGYPGKTTTLGTTDSIVMGVREVYPRATLLPSDWHQVRIGMLYSIVGLNADDNTAPTVETVTILNHRDRFALGLFNGAANGCAGDAGTRFVGIMSGTTAPIAVSYSNPNYTVLWTSNANNGVIGDGASVVNSGTGIGLTNSTAIHATPAGTSSFCAFLGVDITLSSTGTTTKRQAVSSITDTSILNLRKLMLETTLTGAGVCTGGWWGAGLDSGLTHLYVRAPHNQNRLRIHGLQVMQIA